MAAVTHLNVTATYQFNSGAFVWRTCEFMMRRQKSKIAAALPEQYQLGYSEFLGCRIDLSLRPFIPRPETAQMVKAATLELRRSAEPTIKCLDLFAGSGCVGLALLKHLSQAEVDFGELELKFLRQIQINLKLNKIAPSRYGLINTDVFSGVSFKYDRILANPPYVAELQRDQVQDNVLVHEPAGALFAGPDGLALIRKFLAQVQDYLKPNGQLYMEFDPRQQQAIEQLLIKHGYKHYAFYRDSSGAWRWLRASKH